jgi:hypothetical protein
MEPRTKEELAKALTEEVEARQRSEQQLRERAERAERELRELRERNERNEMRAERAEQQLRERAEQDVLREQVRQQRSVQSGSHGSRVEASDHISTARGDQQPQRQHGPAPTTPTTSVQQHRQVQPEDQHAETQLEGAQQGEEQQQQGQEERQQEDDEEEGES